MDGLDLAPGILETIRRVQWLVTPRAARGWRFGAWPTAKRRFTLLDFAREAWGPSKVHTGTDILTSSKKLSRHRISHVTATTLTDKFASVGILCHLVSRISILYPVREYRSFGFLEIKIRFANVSKNEF